MHPGTAARRRRAVERRRQVLRPRVTSSVTAPLDFPLDFGALPFHLVPSLPPSLTSLLTRQLCNSFFFFFSLGSSSFHFLSVTRHGRGHIAKRSLETFCFLNATRLRLALASIRGTFATPKRKRRPRDLFFFFFLFQDQRLR
ncbi:hypothetical protein PUN28_002384 [Cardiocondyla obscurior]|uniref:Transmembrane protein n=1 Tax=Cardiocondyla obscurior TaxID=286306 RepID=A0AAW2GTT8_9HYME